MSFYHSQFNPSRHGLDILVKGKILGPDETPTQMIERVVNTLVEIENHFGTPEVEKVNLANEFGKLLDDKCIMMSTPILTNAGRYVKRPLSACTVPSLDLAHDGIRHIKKVITKMHEDGMGTGFCLDGLKDPVAVLKKLNAIAVEGSHSGKEDRPVGNMGTIRYNDAHIIDFVRVKVGADQRGEDWRFNLSVDCAAEFFRKVEDDDMVELTDGTSLKAQYIFNEIVEAVHSCADPGLIFIDRMEADNSLPCVGHYITTAPCAEVGLDKGESCQFGYINVSKFICGDGSLDIEKLRKAAHIMTHMLDNALEISIKNYAEAVNSKVMLMKRKIGVGICGLADLFVKKKVLYSSPEAREMALDIVSLINFESKRASYELARKRKSFGAMNESIGNRYLELPSFVEKKYGTLESKYVSIREWIELSEKIRSEKMLRNASTIALPPTGRSALIIDASTGIEPIFSKDVYLNLHQDLSDEYIKYIQIAKNISPIDHLRMAAVLQKAVDESISKTINMTFDMSKDDIGEIYKMAWSLGLKGISVYREGSRNAQPKKLN